MALSSSSTAVLNEEEGTGLEGWVRGGVDGPAGHLGHGRAECTSGWPAAIPAGPICFFSTSEHGVWFSHTTDVEQQSLANCYGTHPCT